jgi:hypothetical protein
VFLHHKHALLQIALTNAPDCPTNRQVQIAGSVTSCTNVVSITYTLNSGSAVTLCNNCGVNPSFAFAITLSDCVNHLMVKATDVNGGVASVSQDLHFDVTPPVLSGCPAPTLAVLCVADVPAAATVTALDVCNGVLPVAFNETSSGPDCNKTIIRTWTATDTCLNTASCTQTITVRDTTSPTVSFCPTSIIACLSPSGCGVMPDATGQVLANDPCGTVAVTQSIPPGQTVCSTAIVVFTITDPCGNATTCTAPVLLQPCCVTPPAGMKLWLTFDEPDGVTCLNSMGGNNGVRYNGEVLPTSTGPTRLPGQYVNRSLCFDDTKQEAVRVVNYPGIDLGTSDFSIDAWVKQGPTRSNNRSIVDKRVATFNLAQITGYVFFLQNGYPALQLADGLDTPTWKTFLLSAIPANRLPIDQWTHLAVTVDRDNMHGVRFYINGEPASPPDDNPIPRAASLSNNSDLWVGSSPLTFNNVRPFNGCLDEIEIFQRVLTPNEVKGIYQAGTKGKCRPYGIVPAVLSLCTDSATLSATVCNPGAVGQSFTVSFTGLTALECGLPGAVNWPSSPNPFSPSTAMIYVGPNSCTTLPVTITRPPALYGSPYLGTQKVACYRMVVATAAGEKFGCEGRLVDGAWNCPVGAGSGKTNLIAKGTNSVVIPFTLTNPTNMTVTLHPTVRVLWAQDNLLVTETNVVSLNGLPPGTPWTGTVVLPPGGTTNLPVNVRFIATQPATPFYVVLEADIGEGGSMEAIASATVLNENPATVGPVLNVSLSGNLPVISWDVVNSPFVLESSESLGGTNWAPVPELAVPLPDGSEGVILQGTNSSRYFRGRQ